MMSQLSDVCSSPLCFSSCALVVFTRVPSSVLKDHGTGLTWCCNSAISALLPCALAAVLWRSSQGCHLVCLRTTALVLGIWQDFSHVQLPGLSDDYQPRKQSLVWSALKIDTTVAIRDGIAPFFWAVEKVFSFSLGIGSWKFLCATCVSLISTGSCTYVGMREHTAKPVLRDHCLGRPPVLRDQRC